ncbi:MAG: hypothetical protein WCD88_15445, partial [Desulfobacterales bacterium]
SVAVGTYGLYAKVKPDSSTGKTNDSYTDVAFDAQYQFIASPHLFSVQGTYIHEKQNLDGSYELGLADNPNSNLDQFKVNVNYFYRSGYGPIGGSVGYFLVDGDTDPTLYSPNPVDGSRTGSPNSKGFIFEADYVFREKYKFSLQYTLYQEFNGASSNYDGFGRDASDNNTFYALIWLMF